MVRSLTIHSQKNRPHQFGGLGVKPDSGSYNCQAFKFPKGAWSIFRKKKVHAKTNNLRKSFPYRGNYWSFERFITITLTLILMAMLYYDN